MLDIFDYEILGEGEYTAIECILLCIEIAIFWMYKAGRTGAWLSEEDRQELEELDDVIRELKIGGVKEL